MTMQELIDYLKQNEEIGRNRPTSEVKIAIGVLKLKEAGFPEPAAEYHTLLRNFNGLSNNGCFILGINTESSFFRIFWIIMSGKRKISPPENSSSAITMRSG